jgi:hypothetical protein
MRYIRPHLDIRVILELNGTFCQEWVLYDFSLVVLHTKSIFFSSTCGSWLETAFEFGGCATYFDSSRAKLNLAPLESLTLNE